MDNADAAQESIDLSIKASLSNRSTKQLAFTGQCYNCREPLVEARFCDADCRDDHEKREAFNA